MERPSVWNRVAAVGLGLWSCGALLAFGQAPQPLVPAVQLAQVPRPVPGRGLRADPRPEDDLSLDGVFLPPDRTAKRRLESAQQMIDDGRFGEAVRLLGTLLENAEDYFFKPNAEESVYRSLKAEAGRLIAALPTEGRQSYELQFGSRARQMLKQAAQNGNLTELAEVSRQFFFTQAGQEATFLLGRHHLDQNRPLAAALCFERLRALGRASDSLEPVLSLSLATCWLRAGKPDKAREALVLLKRTHPGAEVVLAGKSMKLFANESQALAWLQDKLGPQHSQHSQHLAEAGGWTLFRGNEARNAPSVGGQPLLSARWRQRTADDRAVEKFVTKLRQDYQSQEIVVLPSFQPLAVGDVVLMRTAFAVQAVDFQNGKLVWRYPATDDSFDQFLKAGSSAQPGQSVQLFSGLDQRIWEDATYGTLSSDGDQVYFIEDLGLGTNPSPLVTFLPNGRRLTVSTRNANRLAARELRTQGKLKWEVGGIAGGDEPKLAGAFFLGPPLPLLGHLYVMAEMKSQEIRLVVLSSKTGALEWSQQLAVVETPITMDTNRRNAGATPSFADGVIVCPTSAGAVVAIDSATHSLLWGYQYPRSQQSTDRFNAVRLAIYPGTERHANEHWADGSSTISDGRVLLTPIESDQLYCLNLADGKELWKQNRGSNFYVACVHSGNVILVGRNTVSAIKLADGEKTWKDLELPAGAMPSGRGFYSGDSYYLPLTSAEVAKINLKTGQIQQRSKSRTGTVPGNLVCYRGSIISQGADYLDAYYQLDALKEQIAKTLDAQPEDAKALAALAEIKLDQGALGEAIELFRNSYRLKSDDTTREQLVEAMLEGLRNDFTAHRGSLAELDKLIEKDEQRLKYLRLMALGLQSAGEVLPAFETYLKLADQDASLTLDAIEEGLTTRRDRWIQTQLERLQEAASQDQQQTMDAEVAVRLQAALESNSAARLRAFLAIFEGHALANRARQSLLTKLGNTDLLEADGLLRKLERTGTEPQIAYGVARVASLLRETGRADVAAFYFDQLAHRFAKIDCLDGKTGGQIVAELPADQPIRKWLASAGPWPLGKVVTREEKSNLRTGTPRPQRVADLEIVGPAGPLFKNMNIVLDSAQKVLVGQDGMGEKRFRIQISESNSRFPRPNGYNAPPLSYVSVNGGLMVLSTSNQLMAVDALRGPDNTNHVLWTHDLSDQIGGFPTSQGIFSRPVDLPWGGRRFVPEDAMGRRYGSIGPVTDGGVFFQRLRELHCVDPLTGATIWTRKNAALGNDLFGDGELLFVAPPGDGDTLVLRAATGEKMGDRRIASFDKRITTIGRQVLSWEPQDGRQIMQMRDPWEDKTLWSFPFTAGTKAALVSHEAAGVFQPDGQFFLIRLSDGKLLANEKLEPESSLIGIHLLASQDQYLLVVNTGVRQEHNVTVQPIPASVVNNPLISGRVYGFDRTTGKKLWPAPAVVAQYGMLLNQPSQLPVLVFVRMVHRAPPGGARSDPKASVLCIDKRTGRVVYENDQLPASMIGSFELSGDPATHTVTLNLAPTLITLTFTDDLAAGPEILKSAVAPDSSKPELPRPRDAEPIKTKVEDSSSQ